MELNQDFGLVRQLLNTFEDPYLYEMDYVGPGACRTTDEVQSTNEILGISNSEVRSTHCCESVFVVE